jgi:hypothetical protein
LKVETNTKKQLNKEKAAFSDVSAEIEEPF